jgi:uncharacterized protein
VKFEWDKKKEKININKHGISFEQAKLAFMDTDRIITKDINHSSEYEERFFLFWKNQIWNNNREIYIAG